MHFRGQLIARAHTKSQPGPTQNYSLIGIVEVPQDSFPEHVMHGLCVLQSHGKLSLKLTDYSAELPGGGKAKEFGNLSLDPIWPISEGIYDFADGEGGITFRDTRMPARPGYKIAYALAVLTVTNAEILHHHIYAVDGTIEKSADQYNYAKTGLLVLTVPRETEIPAGLNLSQLLKLPLWGWNTKKVAFRSTMDLQTIDLCDKLSRQ